MKHTITIYIALSIAYSFGGNRAISQWIPDPAINNKIAGGGTPINLLSLDGFDGFYSFWERATTQDSVFLFGQRTLPDGSNQWGNNGRLIAFAASDYRDAHPPVALEVEENAYVFWVHVAGNGSLIHCMRLDTMGVPIWAQPRVIGQDALNFYNQDLGALVLSDSMHMWISWLNSSEQIVCNVIDTAGVSSLSSPIYVDSTCISTPYKLIRVSDSSVAIVYSRTERTTPLNKEGIYMQQYSYIGSQKWTYGGVVVSRNARIGPRFDAVSISDTGIFVSWVEADSVNRVKYQIISSNGLPVLDSLGVDIATSGKNIIGVQSRLGVDGSVYVTFYSDSVIYVSRITKTGVIAWNNAGVIVNEWALHGSWPETVSLPNGDLLVAWVDKRNNSQTMLDIYSQRIDSSGSILWTYGGAPVCVRDNSQYGLQIVGSDTNPILVWIDARSDSQGVYASMINQNGSLMPVTISVMDGECVNGRIRIAWTVREESNLLAYRIERGLRSEESEHWIIRGSIFPVVGDGEKSYEFWETANEISDELLPVFRLRLEYLDGSVEYSPSIVISDCEYTSIPTLDVYPNPSTDGSIHIAGSLDAYDNIYICDIYGRRLITFVVTEIYNEDSDVGAISKTRNGLIPGVYYLIANGKVGSLIKKVVIIQ